MGAMKRSLKTYYPYPTPYGILTIAATDCAITHLCLGQAAFEGEPKATRTTTLCATQILEYLAGKRQRFSVAFEAQGTDFQRSVWKEVGTIPYGQTRTPREVAEAIGAPQSFRLVGAALRANPLPILIPTHRVVGAAGYPLGTSKEARLLHACLQLERQTEKSLSRQGNRERRPVRTEEKEG